MPQSLFTSQVPSVTNASDGTPTITRGVTLQFGVDGSITHVRWWCPTTTSGIYTVAVWELTSASTGTLLASKVHVGTPTGDGWNVTALDTPVTIDTTKAYRVGVNNSEGRYVASSGFFVTPLVNGDITAEATGQTASGFTIGQGVFNIGASLAFPNTAGSATNYFTDAVFLPASEGGSVTGSAALVLPPLALSGSGTPEPNLSGTIGLPGLDVSGTGLPDAVDDPQEGAAYEIEDIMEALAGIFNEIGTGDTIGGVPITLECHAEVTGQVQPPAIVLEVDDQTWDLNMGNGADSLGIVALALVQQADQDNAQRALWRFLSRKRLGGVVRLKAALEADQTLGGLVSYAIMTGVRNIGIITYNGVDYLGAELIIEVVS